MVSRGIACGLRPPSHPSCQRKSYCIEPRVGNQTALVKLPRSIFGRQYIFGSISFLTQIDHQPNSESHFVKCLERDVGNRIIWHDKAQIFSVFGRFPHNSQVLLLWLCNKNDHLQQPRLCFEWDLDPVTTNHYVFALTLNISNVTARPLSDADPHG